MTHQNPTVWLQRRAYAHAHAHAHFDDGSGLGAGAEELGREKIEVRAADLGSGYWFLTANLVVGGNSETVWSQQMHPLGKRT